MRAVLHTVFSLHRSGCQWERLPHALLPKSTVYASGSPGRDDGTWAKSVHARRERRRGEAGHAPTPSAAGIASPSRKTTEGGGPERGDDDGEKRPGRQRPLWVDTLGWLLAVVMTSAALDAGVGAAPLLGHVLAAALPRLRPLFADKQDQPQARDAWRAAHRPAWHRESTMRPEGSPGFTPLAKRWGVAGPHAWQGRYRRNSKDEERRVASSTALMQLSPIQLMVHRRAPGRRPVFPYRKEAA